MHRSDEELVDDANVEEPSALRVLYTRHKQWVFGVAMKFIGNKDDAADVLQDVFIYFFGRFPGFKLTSTLRAYLFPVTRSHAMSWLRRARKVVSLHDEQEGNVKPSQILDAANWSIGAEGDFARLVAVLPEPQRRVINLRFVGGLKLEEISEVLEIPKGTVKSRLHNALTTLREKFLDLRP